MDWYKEVYQWPEAHTPEDIAEFTISSGNFPIRIYHLTGSALSGHNTVNGFRDGSLYYPPGFFLGRTVHLTKTELASVRELLLGMDFQTWETTDRVLESFRQEEFCLTESFQCVFHDGKKFEYAGLPGETAPEFGALYRLLDSLCPGPSYDSGSRPDPSNKKTYKIQCPACGGAVRPRTGYCSICGQPLESGAPYVLTMEEVDPEETLRRCRFCGGDVSFADVFCRSCGRRIR